MLIFAQEVRNMEKFVFRFLIPFAAVLLLTHLNVCAQVSVKGTPPQYIGLGGQVVSSAGSTAEASKSNAGAPLIKNAYAVDQGRYGEVLKIYLEAEDPSGEMTQIATTVDEVGYGHYPTDLIILKPQYRKSFRGYIQWNTFSSRAPYLDEWTRIEVKVAVLDKDGRVSNEFELPFTFETGVGPAPNPPAPFNVGDLPRLGNVSVNLFNPRVMGGGKRD